MIYRLVCYPPATSPSAKTWAKSASASLAWKLVVISNGRRTCNYPGVMLLLIVFKLGFPNAELKVRWILQLGNRTPFNPMGFFTPTPPSIVPYPSPSPPDTLMLPHDPPQRRGEVGEGDLANHFSKIYHGWQSGCSYPMQLYTNYLSCSLLNCR